MDTTQVGASTDSYKIASNGYLQASLALHLLIMIAILAAIIDPTIRPMTFGIVLGGIINLFFLPFTDKYLVKQNHIMVGDHGYKKRFRKALNE